MKLEAEQVSVRFGGVVALDRVDVSVESGSITGVIGPNGAGKTTLFNVCCGYQRPASGAVRLDGVDVTRVGAVRRARRGLGRTFQRIESFGSLTVRDNIEIAAEAAALGDSPLALLGLTRRRTAEVHQVADEVMARTGLGDDGELLARQLSTGNARLLELGRCLARQPRLLLLDEPSSGLNPEETERFGALLLDLVIEDGIGILLVEHDMSLALTVCERLLVLDFGEELFVGAPAEIRASSTVRKAYLGAMEEV